MPLRIAVIQPYFIPYVGYFRLLAASDLFVILDSVQFSKTGWVHRNRLPDHESNPQWLTLPLARMPLGSSIRDMTFLPDAPELLRNRLNRFPALGDARPAARDLIRAMLALDTLPIDYIVGLLEQAAGVLGLPWQVMLSSDLDIAPDLAGQDRIIAIVRGLGGTSYVNAPGGRALYDPVAFERAGIELRFLSDYSGPAWSVLWRLAREDPAALRAEIHLSTELVA